MSNDRNSLRWLTPSEAEALPADAIVLDSCGLRIVTACGFPDCERAAQRETRLLPMCEEHADMVAPPSRYSRLRWSCSREEA